MKTKHYFLISLLLIGLIMIPVSFAADDNQIANLNDNNELNLELNDINTDLICENTVEEKLEIETLDEEDDLNILESNEIDTNIIENTAEDIIDEEILENSDSENLKEDIYTEHSGSENLKEDIYTEYSDYINLKSEMLTYDFNISDSNTIFVNSSYTGDEELGTQLNPFKTITSAYNCFINDTNSKTNIFLADGTYTTTGRMTINKNLNLIGQSTLNTIINGEGNRYNNGIFFITPQMGYLAIVSPWVNFVNLTFTGGKSYYGGAVYINQSAVNFVYSRFKKNKANDYYDYTTRRTYPASGGAIYNDKGFVRIYNSLFEENMANGSLDSYAGAVFNDMGEMTILNSKFIDNSVNATYGSGGAIYDYSGILVIYNTTIANNSIDSNYSMGGGICNWASHNIFIINSTIDGNKLYGDYTFGSAISNKANILEIHNTTISNNQANGISVENGTLFNLNGIVNLINTNFTNNLVQTVQNDLLFCLEDQIIVGKAFDDDLLVNLPSSYDLRDEGLITPVKDQRGSGSCWAFTTIAAIESYLLKYENISYDLSENNMKNLMGVYGLEGTDWSDGGNYYMALAYLLRWSGPINETDDPFSDISHSSPTKLKPVKHIQDALFVPVRLNYKDLNQIKYAIMSYGALYVSMQADDSFKWEPDYYHDIIDTSNHAVTLIGWDDNYSADNFALRPPGNGAFIIKNSWGTDHGHDGYWYISYYDKAFAGYGLDTISAMAITSAENITNYKNIYQYDILGNTFESLGFNSHTAWMANQFTATNDNPLSAFGLYTFGDSQYLVNITVNGISKCIQEGIVKGAGYHTIKLNEFINLAKDDIFKIAVKLTTPDSFYPIAIESQREGYSSGASANPGESFISIDGENWIDLVDYKNLYEDGLKVIKFYQYAQDYDLKEANVCLKAYTTSLGDVSLHIKTNSSTYKVGDLVEVILTVSNEGDLVHDLNISINIDNSIGIKTYQIIKGSFNSGTNVWHLDSLDEGESSVLKITFQTKQAKEIIPILFSFDYVGFKPLNMTNSSILNLHYEGNTRFLEIEDVITLSKSNENVVFNLLDQGLNPVIGKEIVVSLIEFNGNSNPNFNPVPLILDENGSAKFTLDLLEGNYKFLVSFKGDSYYKSSNETFNVSVSKRNSPHIIVENTLIKNDEFNAVLIDDNFKGLANKAVKFVVTSGTKVLITATARTNNDGVAKLTGLSKLANGDYSVKISFVDDMFKESTLTKKITIKKESKSSPKVKKIVKKATKILMKKKTFKAKKKVKKISATLKVGKKALKGKKIIFKINKKKYTAKTNKKGVATVKIKLSKKKTYKVIVRFAGDKYYKASKKTSKVVIK